MFDRKVVKVVGIEDQLIQCLYDVSRISETQKVDPKQLDDVHILMKIADKQLAEQIWKKNNHPSHPKELNEAIKRVDRLRKEKRNWWQVKPYRKQAPYRCPHCKTDPKYPITDMSIIYKVLGYVE